MHEWIKKQKFASYVTHYWSFPTSLSWSITVSISDVASLIMSSITSDIEVIISYLDPSGVMTFTALNERGGMIMSGIRKCMKSFEEREE